MIAIQSRSRMGHSSTELTEGAGAIVAETVIAAARAVTNFILSSP
jgi:hypothetical protein